LPNLNKKGVFAMLVRNCAGGVIFSESNKVFLLRNDKGEWVFPKGVVRNGDLPNEVALRRVKDEAGITAEIVSPAGRTNYEFFSVSRQKPVCNKITWYLMKSLNEDYKVNKEENFTDGGYFSIDEAMQLVTHSQDRALLNLSYNLFKQLVAV
jgi:8-oxo-dGTP pyrophosphatase MutT (NUDIX family)